MLSRIRGVPIESLQYSDLFISEKLKMEIMARMYDDAAIARERRDKMVKIAQEKKIKEARLKLARARATRQLGVASRSWGGMVDPVTGVVRQDALDRCGGARGTNPPPPAYT